MRWMAPGWTRWWVAGALAALLAACSDDGAKSRPAEVAGAAAQAAPEPRATLGAVTGEVTVKRAAGDDWRPASEAMKLFENDKVRTARGASVQIRFTNGSLLTVGEDALVGVAEARPRPGVEASDLTVLKGRIDAELPDPRSQSLVVTTPSATVRAGREIVFQ